MTTHRTTLTAVGLAFEVGVLTMVAAAPDDGDLATLPTGVFWLALCCAVVAGLCALASVVLVDASVAAVVVIAFGAVDRGATIGWDSLWFVSVAATAAMHCVAAAVAYGLVRALSRLRS